MHAVKPLVFPFRFCLAYYHNRPIDSKYYHVQLPDSIPKMLSLLSGESNLNEKAVLLQEVSELILTNKNTYISRKHIDQLSKEIEKWQGGSGRFQRIATVAWVIHRLDLVERHGGLFNEIVERIRNDEWYVTLDECIKALESFCRLGASEEKEALLARIEGNIRKTLFEDNMKAYKRVACGLLLSGSHQSPLWQYMEEQIVQNLQRNYEVETIAQIFRAYALTRNGSHLFYNRLQTALYLGHQLRSKIKAFFAPQLYSGQFYALMIQTYYLCHQQVEVLPEFLDYIYNSIRDSRVKYSLLSSYTKIIECLPLLLDSYSDAHRAINKLLSYPPPPQVSIIDMIDFYAVAKQKDITVPQNIHHHIQTTLLKDISNHRYSPIELMRWHDALKHNLLIPHNQTYTQAIQQAFADTIKYIEGPQIQEILHKSRLFKQLPRAVSQLAVPTIQ